MLLKSCLDCRYHEITDESGEQTSLCLKESCYSRFTKCVAQKALNSFLKDESCRQIFSKNRCVIRYARTESMGAHSTNRRLKNHGGVMVK